MMSGHLLQRVDDPPIRRTVEVRKRHQPVREIRPPSILLAQARRVETVGCVLRSKNRCDLVTIGWKVLKRRGIWRKRRERGASGSAGVAALIKILFYQDVTGQRSMDSRVVFAAGSLRSEQGRVNTCGFLRLSPSSFRSNDERG
jgi:hypothetical protein